MAKKANAKQKLRWEECYAKLVLEKVFPDRFFDLKIEDKPDLQSTVLDVGIEVTTAIPDRVIENDRLFSRLTHDDGNPEHRNRNLNRVQQKGGQYYDEGVMFCWTGVRNICEVYSAFENKIKKLNGGGYKLFSKQYVFIVENDITIQRDDLSKIHSELNRRQTSFSARFDSVFLNYDRSLLFEFDLNSGEYHQYRIDDYETLATEAYNMVHN